MKHIAIQGGRGSYHHLIAYKCYGEEIQLKECMSFDAVVDALVHKEAEEAIMALENSIAGSIIPNYARIDTHDLYIIGEQYLNIDHQFMALSGQKIGDIHEVWSHPMALLQCSAFFHRYPHIKLVEDVDTADVARRIQEEQISGVGAVASTLAASIYDLEVLAQNIQNVAINQTRFVVLRTAAHSSDPATINKASIKFQLDHKRGSLAAVLNVMSDCKLSLTKIQSLPIVETPWKYAFFVDVTFQKYGDYEKAKAILEIMAENFKVLGEYKDTIR